MLFSTVDMAFHSSGVTVDFAPVPSAVSVVGTGVELGARAVAMVLCACWLVEG